MLNYKPNNSIKEFEPAQRPDPEIMIKMLDPGYIANHKRAIANF